MRRKFCVSPPPERNVFSYIAIRRGRNGLFNRRMAIRRARNGLYAWNIAIRRPRKGLCGWNIAIRRGRKGLYAGLEGPH